MGISAGLVGVGGALSGLFGGSNQVPTYTPYVNPSAIYGTINQASSGIGPVQSTANQLNPYAAQPFTSFLPAANSAISAITGNPYYASQYQNTANQAAQMGETAAIQSLNAGETAVNQGLNLYNTAALTTPMAMSLVPGAQTLQQLGLDPQSALYNQQLNNLTQQIDVANAQSGLSTSPYGASVLANALGNFNINWQNNQLQRAIAGEQGAAGLLNTAGGLLGTGANIASTGTGIIGQGSQIAGTAPLSYAQAGGLPYATQLGIGNDTLAALSNYSGAVGGLAGTASSILQPQESSIADYLGIANAYNALNQQGVQAYNAQVGAQGQQFEQNQLLGSSLGRSLGMLGGSTGTGGNAWSGLNFNNSPLWANLAGNPYNPG